MQPLIQVMTMKMRQRQLIKKKQLIMKQTLKMKYLLLKTVSQLWRRIVVVRQLPMMRYPILHPMLHQMKIMRFHRLGPGSYAPYEAACTGRRSAPPPWP